MIKKGHKGFPGYQNLYFCNGENLFDGLSQEEQTAILVIACADSRVFSGHGTYSVTGDLHILHLDNIVPFNSAVEDNNIIASEIDHTLSISTVTDIVVCGFSNYGSGQFADAFFKQRNIVLAHIIDQLKRVSSCPIVKRGLKDEVLSLHGWHYEMFTGKWFAFSSFSNSFEEINFV